MKERRLSGQVRNDYAKLRDFIETKYGPEYGHAAQINEYRVKSAIIRKQG